MADLIDRIELMRQIAEFGREIPKDQVIGVIARQEAVEVEGRPKGVWVYHEDYKLDGECCYECSECGRMYDYKMNYCGFCGSDNRVTQYCRYCTYMTCGDANWCEIKKRTFSDATIKSTNSCEYFELNPIDALGENPNEYKPRISTIYRKGEFSDEDIKELERQCEMLLDYTKKGEDE